VICPNCEVAGYVNEEANERMWDKGTAAVGPLREMARKWHRKCKDKGCACQHIVGDLINPIDVPEVIRRQAHAAKHRKFRHHIEQLLESL
jgi:hypothetical protein